jgi:hypothetical protein
VIKKACVVNVLDIIGVGERFLRVSFQMKWKKLIIELLRTSFKLIDLEPNESAEIGIVCRFKGISELEYDQI